MSKISQYIQRRNALLTEKNIPNKITWQAWLMLSHMILDEGARVAHMGCDDGALSYAMAALYPEIQIIGIDNDKRKVNKARVSYDLPNLEFRHANIAEKFTKKGAFDAIINAFVLHEIYSNTRYTTDSIHETFKNHFHMLKDNGLMFIQDYAKPPPEIYVKLEIPDEESTGKALKDLSEADLLTWYSEHARPRNDSGTGGFFLDELPEKTPGTRLFRIPYRWAYEFIMRKDDRKNWEKELPIEYTFFTQQEFRQAIRKHGARASYTAPHWDEDYLQENFREKFQLLKDDDTPMGYPPTSFIVVARKMAQRKSLLIHERRPTKTDESKLKITAMRNHQTGEIVDIVGRDEQIGEIIPYRIDPETGRLKIYLHDGVPRSITNSVPRNGVSIDDRRWSGHMIEPISLPQEHIPNTQIEPAELIKDTKNFAKKYLGLETKLNQPLKLGPDYFPAPDFVDELVNTYYLEVKKSKGHIEPQTHLIGTKNFQEKGYIREVDAQQILDAITVGKIPSARLELQILFLFNHLNIKSENWGQKDVTWKIGEIKQKTSLRDVLDKYGSEGKVFKEAGGSAGQLRSVHSIFVEEGQTKGSVAGLSARDLDFVVHNEQTINTAVVLPLSKGLKKDVHAGFTLKQMPIPERHKGSSSIISAPSFNLPAHITNIKLAREYIAEQMGVLPDMVIKMGESYFSHIGISQQKIHPFAVIVPEGKPKDPGTQFIPFYQFMLLRKSLSKDTHFMVILARAYRYLHEDIQMDFSRRVSAIVKERFEQVKPEWTLPLTFEPSPIRKPIKDTPEIEKELENNIDTKKDKNKEPEKLEKQKSIQASETLRNDKEYKPKPENNINLSAEFEHEFEDFIDTLEQNPPKLEFDY